jgi:RNA polymerase sigma-70 factor (ECF subfamily)
MLSTDSDVLAYTFARYRGDVYAFVLRRTRNRHDAEELTQQTFVDAAAALERGTVPRSTRSWLFAVAERRIVDERRRRARPLDGEPAAVQHEEGGELPLAGALGLLTADEQRLLFLRVVEERTHAEVAAAVGCSEGAARMRASRALRRLRRGLGVDL